MKNRLTVMAMALLLAVQVQAQSTYLTVGIGYGIPAAPAITATDNSASASGTGTTYNNKIDKGNGSLGKGTQFGLAYGRMFNENIGVELGIGYLAGATLTSKESQTGAGSTFSFTQTFSSHMLRFTPAIRLAVGTGNVRPYLRTGLVIGVSPQVNYSSASTDNFSGTTTTSNRDQKFTGGTSLGFAMGAGANFKAGNGSFFAEFGVIAQSWAPTKGEITKLTQNGVDQLPSMTISQKQSEYVDSYSEGPGAPSSSVPNKSLKQFLPFSSVGVNIGWRFSFGGATAAK